MRAPAGVTVAVVLALGLGAKLSRGLEAYTQRTRPVAAAGQPDGGLAAPAPTTASPAALGPGRPAS